MTKRIAQAPKMTEAQFQQQVIEYAHLMNWKVAHFRTAMTRDGRYLTPVGADGKGFPDLVLLRPPRIIFAELKAQRGVLSDEQKDWFGALCLCASPIVQAFVWRPSDWPSVEAELAR